MSCSYTMPGGRASTTGVAAAPTAGVHRIGLIRRNWIQRRGCTTTERGTTIPS